MRIKPEAVIVGSGNGIRAQALRWADLLGRMGHSVELINSWRNYDWSSYDIIHVFGGVSQDWYSQLRKINPNMVISPIWDKTINFFTYSIRTRMRLKGLGYVHPCARISANLRDFAKVFVRSKYEADVMRRVFGVPNEKIAVVPLCYEVSTDSNRRCEREDYCFHLSLFTQPRKNVARLISAAVKFGFRLVVAGKAPEGRELDSIMHLASQSSLVEIRGFIDEEEMYSHFLCAKVFALPSIEEGVGLTALNAAALGSNVVITKLGGPKDYFGGLGYQVDPFSIDEIGRAVKLAMRENNMRQPALSNYVKANYNPERIATLLYNAYCGILGSVPLVKL